MFNHLIEAHFVNTYEMRQKSEQMWLGIKVGYRKGEFYKKLTVEVGKEAKKVRVGLPHEASSVWGSIREKIRGASSFPGQIVVSRAIVRRGGIRFD